MAQEHPPTILQIYRDFFEPGREEDFKAVEEDAARICADLGFPHPHLALSGGARGMPAGEGIAADPTFWKANPWPE